MSKFQLSYILQIVYIFYRCKCIKIKTAHLFYWYLEYMSILSLILIIYLFISTKMYAFLAVWEEWKKYRELWVMQLIQEKVGITPRWRRSLFAPLTLEKPGEAAGHCVLPTGELAKCLEKSCRKVLLSPKRWHPTEGLEIVTKMLVSTCFLAFCCHVMIASQEVAKDIQRDSYAPQFPSHGFILHSYSSVSNQDFDIGTICVYS